MSAVRTVYHLARADFLERVRRYSFLIMLGLVAFLGYQVAVGNIALRLDVYRGEFNSAWVGSMMALIGSFFLGWFGFFLVKGSIARDRETGVGQIMAATPLTRPLYTFGKWASNFSVLMTMILVLATASIGIQFLAGENTHVDLFALLAPFLFVTMPVMALVSAIAVLFESIDFLSGGFGNVLYFFLFLMLLPLMDRLSDINPALEPLGLGLFQQSMGDAAKAAFPAYSGGFVLSDPATTSFVFQWPGVDWTSDILFMRLALFGAASALVLVASIFFDRFDTSRRGPSREWRKNNAAGIRSEPAPMPQAAPTVRLTPLYASAGQLRFVRVLVSELNLLIKGQPWWWYAVAGGLIVAGLVNPVAISRTYLLPLTWLWPVLLWSSLGNRAFRHNAQQMIFSAAAPLWRQMPASWLAGFLVALLTGGGVAVRLISAGDSTGLLIWVSAALFIPSFALASGVWSRGNKVFEVLYVTMWYQGPMNKIAALDFMGASTDGYPLVYLGASLTLVVLAFAGRARQLQN